MKFINREKEINTLEDARILSRRKLFSVAIWGLRRVGKTRMMLEFMKDTDMYFFVNKDKTSISLLDEYETYLRNAKIINELEKLNSWDDFFNVLFERYEGIVAFDEFQNFLSVDRSVFGTLQKHIDLNEDKKGLLLFFTGSTTGLIKKLFLDLKQPLYGRIKRQMHLKPMSFKNIIDMCSELGITDYSEIVKLYAVAGGYPRYYVAIEDENLNNVSFENIVDRFFFVENAIFEDEVMSILSLEFGKRSGVYYDILTAVASGCTRISEIASFLTKKETDLTRQIHELVHHFNILDYEEQVIGNKKLLYIDHPLMDFWFRFFYKNISDYKRRNPRFVENTKININNHIGKRFEMICREFLIDQNKIPFEYHKIGRQWGKIKDAPKGQNTYEIDIVALNSDSKEILSVECKWKTLSLKQAENILYDLQEKSKFVGWNNDERAEHFGIIAKNITDKDALRAKGFLVFDLDDM
ncbi:MAG: ATP-binding protein [Methanosarcinaceae archaeon]|nr:ATP-binding protein [Methanosarcinaceae archaeon]